MAIIDLNVLKSKFETGDKPNGSDFVDLIDSLHDVIDISSKANIATTLAGYGITDAVNSTNGSAVNPTITNYIEQVYNNANASSVTINLANGTVQTVSISQATTIVLPSPTAGKAYTIICIYNGAFSPTFTGGGTIKWAGGTAPTPTAANGKFDIYTFMSYNTSTTFGQDGGRNF